jgi:hypothetical protein
MHCPSCHSCGIMESPTVPFCLRVVIVFRDNIYVLIILYSRHLFICEHFWPVCVEQLILGHTYDEYFILLAKSGMTAMWPGNPHLKQAPKV